MAYVLSAVLGYLIGCSSMAYYIGKWKRKDIRTAGSGNLGASNTAVLFGLGTGVLVAIHDIAKGIVAVLIARWLFPEAAYAGAAAGVACVLGHIFPVFLSFRGGKGMASYFGVALALNWKFALVLALVLILITVVTDFIALAAISMVIIVPVYLAVTTGDLALVAILCIGSTVMLFKHRENIVRIARGQEIGLRSTARGKNRIDKK